MGKDPLAHTRAVKHGIYSTKEISPERRTLRAELSEQLDTRSGVIQALKDQVINTVTLANVAQSYVIKRQAEGVGLDDIPLLSKLPAFWNSANRATLAYLAALPKESDDIIDLDELRGTYGTNDS